MQQPNQLTVKSYIKAFNMVEEIATDISSRSLGGLDCYKHEEIIQFLTIGFDHYARNPEKSPRNLAYEAAGAVFFDRSEGNIFEIINNLTCGKVSLGSVVSEKYLHLSGKEIASHIVVIGEEILSAIRKFERL